MTKIPLTVHQGLQISLPSAAANLTWFLLARPPFLPLFPKQLLANFWFLRATASSKSKALCLKQRGRSGYYFIDEWERERERERKVNRVKLEELSRRLISESHSVAVRPA